ncbi:hypothetical protein HPB50_024058 [Hyalomma asiaticum]|uniref:Uncharacterized protein n=1 Tax=Hyalomma asiaticum TaxID=266040 RepID=A0ACB7SQE5_HYAAI|nr:hypothetical protein HPB50_024058 [Hyalomma asiaticum]
MRDAAKKINVAPSKLQQTVMNAKLLHNRLSLSKPNAPHDSSDPSQADSGSGQPATGFTPLMYAVKDSRVGLADKFIDLGANVNAKAKDGQTALHLAAVHVREDMVRLLLNRRADPTVTGGPKGQLPIHVLSARPTGAAIVPLQLLLRAGDKNVRMVPDMNLIRGRRVSLSLSRPADAVIALSVKDAVALVHANDAHSAAAFIATLSHGLGVDCGQYTNVPGKQDDHDQIAQQRHGEGRSHGGRKSEPNPVKSSPSVKTCVRRQEVVSSIRYNQRHSGASDWMVQYTRRMHRHTGDYATQEGRNLGREHTHLVTDEESFAFRLDSFINLASHTLPSYEYGRLSPSQMWCFL